MREMNGPKVITSSRIFGGGVPTLRQRAVRLLIEIFAMNLLPLARGSTARSADQLNGDCARGTGPFGRG